MEGDYKIVDYDKYCPMCKYYDEDESDPKCKCYECLGEPANVDSHKPLYFRKADEYERAQNTKMRNMR